MKLAAIAGVNGAFSDEDIQRVVDLARKARKTWKGSTPRRSTARKSATTMPPAAKAAPKVARKAARKATA